MSICVVLFRPVEIVYFFNCCTYFSVTEKITCKAAMKMKPRTYKNIAFVFSPMFSSWLGGGGGGGKLHNAYVFVIKKIKVVAYLVYRSLYI